MHVLAPVTCSQKILMLKYSHRNWTPSGITTFLLTSLLLSTSVFSSLEPPQMILYIKFPQRKKKGKAWPRIGICSFDLSFVDHPFATENLAAMCAASAVIGDNLTRCGQ